MGIFGCHKGRVQTLSWKYPAGPMRDAVRPLTHFILYIMVGVWPSRYEALSTVTSQRTSIFLWTFLICEHLNSEPLIIRDETVLPDSFRPAKLLKTRDARTWSSFNQQTVPREWLPVSPSVLWQRGGSRMAGENPAAGTLLSLKLSCGKKFWEISLDRMGKNPHRRFYCLWQTPPSHIDFFFYELD